eukprot:567748-Pyramimonas_sp.AAC.1
MFLICLILDNAHGSQKTWLPGFLRVWNGFEAIPFRLGFGSVFEANLSSNVLLTDAGGER